MNRSEVAELLSRAVACEAYPREITETDVLAWHALLRDVDAGDAAGAVAYHYSRSASRLTPAAVRRYVSEVRAGRIARAVDEAPPDPDDVDGYIRTLATRRKVLGSGGALPPPLASPAPPPPEITQRPGRRVESLLIPCPRCAAAPGEQCTTSTGRRLQGHHPSRIEAANRKEFA